MPELPEVEYGRRLAEATLAGQRLLEVWAAPDPIVSPDADPEELQAVLQGRVVLAARRRGKQLWLELDQGPALLMHFGMSGALVAPEDGRLKLHSSPAVEPAGWPPRFCKLRLRVASGELAFVNKRRLGRLLLREQPEQCPPLCNLGFDPLLDPPGPEAFGALLAGRRGTIKGCLLNQRLVAGLGNWLVDEALYLAGVAPRRAAGSLKPDEVAALYTAIVEIVERAVAVDAQSSRFPPEWLFHRRWKRKARAGDGAPIQFDTVAGRTTAWVPSQQR